MREKELFPTKPFTVGPGAWPSTANGLVAFANKRSITLFSDLELHADGTLHLDGVSIRDTNADGDGVTAYIQPEHVDEFLKSCAKIHRELKKRGLLPQLVKKVKP